MLTKQFHDEAVRLMDNPRITGAVFDIPEAVGDATDVARPLLLKLLLNGWITDKEKVFLDSVVPPDCLTFVIRGRDYIHPEGLELFPFEEIETTILHGGEAIFSHRYRPKRMKDTHQEYRIFSAAVNPGETEKIILGFFGPAHRLGTIDEDCGFSRLVETFRRAYATIKSDLSTLKHSLSRSQATILVSRSTGRVQALNRSALKLFSRTDRAMVDIGLDQLKYHLSPLLPDYNLKMENISAGDLGISVVALEPNGGKVDANLEIMRQLSNRINSSVASINLAGDRLRNTTSLSEDNERYRLSETIQAEAQKLSLTERQFTLFTTYDSTEPASQNIETELRQAITGIQRTGIAVTPSTNGNSQVTVTAPRNAYQTLFESVLMNLADACGESGNIDVSVENASSAGLTIRFSTAVNTDISIDTINGHNDAFARHIAGLLGVAMTGDLKTENNTLITEITIKK